MDHFKKKLMGILVLMFCFVSGIAQETTTFLKGLYAFTNVNLIPMNREQILENQTVIVSDGRITALGEAGKTNIPEGVQKIDGRGKYLMPGLTEMHGHIPGKDRPEYAENVLFLYIANGVTTVRNMLGDQYHLELRERVNKGEIPGPDIFAASPWYSNQNAPNPEAGAQLVREHEQMGFDLLKMGSIDRETYLQVARTAHQLSMPFGGHIPEDVGLTGALEAGQKSIDHYDRYVEFLVPEEVSLEGRSRGFFGSGLIDLIDRDRIPLAVQKTVESKTWNVPTLSLIEQLASEIPAEELIQSSEMRYMPRDVLEGWVKFKNDYKKREDFKPEATAALVELRRELTKKLYDAGADIALGSDAPQFFNVPGFSIHTELKMMVASGLTAYEALLTGTRNAADYFGTPQEFGTVQYGRRADLILLDANPLQDVSNVQKRAGVMVRGIWYPEEVIQKRLDEIAEWAKK